ncbi:hypothetical protein AB0L53_53955 [Nonomuraea sp. NPDC052129]|uniref:hypothetical protein n=1 Tax=Nonomuraea sp. NPDC052129 TaxID=3154651 RepID=UPI003442F444
MTEPSGGSNKPKRPVVVPAVALVAVTALGITALLGGFAEVPDPAPPQYGEGAVLDQGQFSTQFVTAKLATQKAKADWDTDKRFVELTFKVTNQGKATAMVGLPPSKPEGSISATSFAGSLVKVTPQVQAKGVPTIYSLSKNAQSGQLQPGVPTTVVLRYDLDGAAKPPQKVTLDVAGFEYEPGFNDPSFHWSLISEETDSEGSGSGVPGSGVPGNGRRPVVQAQVTLPVHGAEAT